MKSTRLYGEMYNQSIHEPTLRLADEKNAGGGVDFTFDTSDNAWAPKSGGLYRFEARAIQPQNVTRQGKASAFIQTEIDLRQYIYLPKWGSVLALRAFAGTTFNEPSYLYEYRLGGDFVRGFYSNRFRDDSVAVVQTEVRFPIWDRAHMGGVAFTDIGAVSERLNNLGKAASPFHPGYGAGLRFGLPPDFDMKVRLDFGVSADQTAFRVSFGEVF